MGERKVLNKYFPPDFDPELLPRNKKPRDRQIEVRIMIPFTMCCKTCGEFMYRGKKFNSKKEVIQDQTYLGIRLHRFFIKCSRCSSEITFRTDPQSADYFMEHGATRNYEIWNDRRDTEETVRADRQEEEEGDVMKALENRTRDSKIEMDILDALDDAKMLNARHQKLDTNKVIQALRESRSANDEKEDIEIDDDDEQLIENTQFASSFKRIEDAEEVRLQEERRKTMEATKAAVQAGLQGKGAAPKKPTALAGRLVLKRKVDDGSKAADKEEDKDKAESTKKEQQKDDKPEECQGLSGLLGDYSSGSDA